MEPSEALLLELIDILFY